jgi:GNAT superfamily N-acetyltransferase
LRHVPVFSDLTLARRLERAEAHSCASFVEARARIAPEAGARWIECGGAYAMFDGPESPITQTFGLGVFEACTPAMLNTIEAFYKECGAPVFHEVSPLAGVAVAELLHTRGYRPMEFTSILYRDVEPVPPSVIDVRLIDPEKEGDVWAETAARGWAPEQPELIDFLRDIGRVTAARKDPLCWIAEIDGEPGAAGGLNIHEGVALFAGASTVPSMRRRGLQYALLAARMQYAATLGQCDLAMMGALPGSASQRNAERHGFRIAYTRVKWVLER